MTIAKGLRVSLRRATPLDRNRVYEWLAQSDLTHNSMGAPLYAEHAIPSFEEFAVEYPIAYFDGRRPYDGRVFIIEQDGGDVGCVAHSEINLLKDVVELKVWLSERSLCGRGYGSQALVLLADWLQSQYGVNRFLARPSRRNVRALRALRRAGFRETDLAAGEVMSKLSLPRSYYHDELLLFRILPLPRATLAADPARTYVFIDSEFTSLIEPELISLGAVATDATAFYCELSGWSFERASEFVQQVVAPLLDGDAVPPNMAADAFATWLDERAGRAPTTLISDSGFDRWAIAELTGREDLPDGVTWLRVPVSYDELDNIASQLNLRRHHALDDARALRHAVQG